MSYVDINLNEVKGYDKLSESAKKLFGEVYKRHNTWHELACREDWVPVQVQECKHHLKVIFKNGEWLHYLPNGTWF
ncbi:hypothetical protein [Geosporobacter ferrireducens]|uniref:hypothetical protein n=1 Tax=Geosporobacter ferrireducens TaxID=1424294 RepID=UPI0009F1DF4A|nr:hypothetical protein [Geosporobacter ferrireducens]